VNPSTAFGISFTDELVRCGLREVVLAPGSRSTPLAMAFGEAERRGLIRLHVRIDERSASFTALGLAKASRQPVAVLCTSGTAAANFHPAVIEADESGVPLLVLTADRPPELRGTGANQVIDQVKLYGSAVRWFCEAGTPEARPGIAGYWRSLACQAWAQASGQAGGLPGPVHLNLAFREPLVPGDATEPDWPETLDGRPAGRPWTSFASGHPARDELELPWTERGVVVCGDGDYDVTALVELAGRAGWPVLAEPSSGARRGPNALSAYQYVLGTPGFMAAHAPDLIISAGRPGLSRPQSTLLGPGRASRHVVIAQGPGRWADPQRAATDVASAIRLTAAPGPPGPGDFGRGDSSPGDSGRGGHDPGGPGPGHAGPGAPGGWLADWRRADGAARRAVDAMLDDDDTLTEPRLARDLANQVPEGALLWTGSSLPVRDIDCHLIPRDDVRILASRGASGIDGTTSAAIGAALAHGGPAFALLGDLTLLHDAPGLALGPGEPRPDLCLVVVNNDGGGIFSTLEQAAFPGSFERIFGTPHGAGLQHLAAAFGLAYQRLEQAADLTKALPGTGVRIVEAQTDRAAGAALRARLRDAAAQAIRGAW
jgi:2-succinyl-5-enolpyruvyl-6-hydroxy-3-cyclohexene-1-carboxylate synthase